VGIDVSTRCPARRRPPGVGGDYGQRSSRRRSSVATCVVPGRFNPLSRAWYASGITLPADWTNVTMAGLYAAPHYIGELIRGDVKIISWPAM
jgi:hypothetical protein